MNDVTKFPRKYDEYGMGRATTGDITAIVIKNCGDLLDTIRDGLLVISDDIPKDQRHEIARELSMMHHMVGLARNCTDLPKVPRSMHLMREADIDREYGDDEGGAA